MENKVTLTYSFSETGDENLFLTLSTKLVESLSSHATEWHQAYGRKTHSFNLKTKILPLTSALLERKDLVTRPYCHIFWTDCSELDQYKSVIKPEITSWLNLLSKQIDCEWIIVLITGDVISRITTKAKLPFPRMSLTDKIRSDFCTKYPHRFHVVHDPNRDAKNSETWAALNSKIASLTVRCMETVVSKYEDQVRTERERRNEQTWDFCSYFLLQEELAFVYEMLDMCNLALVQYDELDAMFTQYVLNANAGEFAHWLGNFSKPIARWHSLLLWKPVDNEARLTIQQGRASLIDVRNYLFSRLSYLLFKNGKLEEVLDRLRYFLHSIDTEIEILEISIPLGAVECWTFMCCLELVEALKKAKSSYEPNTHNGEPNSSLGSEKLHLEYASLWNLARLKLQNLGKLCGLMPNVKTTSSHLQLVVDLLAGMGEGEERGDSVVSPALILREALSSKQNFQKHYFELSELAIGTFKHMKHFRAARSIGQDLAEFYMVLEQPEQAETYLVDAVRTYATDGWVLLYSKANRVLARCYKQMRNIRKYLRLCYALMCDKHVDEKEKSFYCEEISSLSKELVDRSLSINLWPLASVSMVRFPSVQTSFRQGDDQFILFHIHSFAPQSLTFQSLQVSLEFSPRTDVNSFIQRVSSEPKSLNNIASDKGHQITSNKKNSISPNKPLQASRSRYRHFSTTSSRELMFDQVASMDSNGCVQLLSLNSNDSHLTNPSLRLPRSLNLIHATCVAKEGHLTWAGVTCKHTHELLRRQDSNPSQRTKHSVVTSVAMENYDCSLFLPDVTLCPGENQIKVPLKTDLPGSYQLQQLKLTLHKLYFLLPRIYPVISYIVTHRNPSISIAPSSGLICGLVQEITLTIDLGDFSVSQSDNQLFILDLSSKVQCLKHKTCLMSNQLGDRKELECPDINFVDGMIHWQLPSSSHFNKFLLTFYCVCVVDEISHKKDTLMRHRRAKSAPPSSLSRSSKPFLQVEEVNEKSKSDCSGDSGSDSSDEPTANTDTSSKTVVSVQSEKKIRSDRFETIRNSLKESLKVESSPFKMFRSKINVDTVRKNNSSNELSKSKPGSAENLPKFTISDDFIEVTLDGSDDVTSVNSDIRSQDSSFFREDTCSCSASIDVLDASSSEKLNEPFKLSTSKSVIESNPEIISSKPPTQPRFSTTSCQVSVTTPWDSSSDPPLTLNFFHPCEFSHAWNYTSTNQMFITVSLDNVTSVNLSLQNPTLTFNNVENAEIVCVGSNLITVKPGGSCSFVWKITFQSSFPSNISARCQIFILSLLKELDETLSSVTYNFDSEHIEPIYKIHASTDDVIKSGYMTSFRMKVERMREDPGHETTANGQQLLMYQVVDNRGRWAVCGKSNGILSFKSDELLSEGEESFATAVLEVMPLVCGRLHFPYVTLHRYVKRSSEYDERYGSSDSPVLKPPQLKPFDCGEVIYRDQARQILVRPGDESDAEPIVTPL